MKLPIEYRVPDVPDDRPALASAIGPRSPTRRSYRRLFWMLVVSDGLALMAALFLAHVIRFGWTNPPVRLVALSFFAFSTWMILLYAVRTYEVHRLAAADQYRRLAISVTIGTTIIATLSFWSKGSFSRLWVGLAWTFALLFLLASRGAWNSWIERARRVGVFRFRTAIVGTNEEAIRIAAALAQPEFGYRVIGFVTVGESVGQVLPFPTLGAMTQLDDLIVRDGIECAFLASSALTGDEMKIAMKESRRRGMEVRVSANLPETSSTRITTQPLGGMAALALRPVQLTGPQAVVKRSVDVVVGTLAIVALSPILIGAALAVRMTSRGPILFRQERVGRHGEPFTLLKFRTMRDQADDDFEALLLLNEATGPLFKIKNDPRVTPVGRVLRRWSLDELPQLFNVLSGAMSVVGPRPALAREVEKYEDWHRDRLEVRPGITGLWQVSGRSDTSFDEYVRLDLYYIENWSLILDLYILIKTLPAVMAKRGAY